MMELTEGKEYWIKQKYLEFVNDGNNRPLKFVDAEGSFHWYKEGLEPVEVIPEREKVVIPKFVADYIEGQRSVLNDFVDSIEEAYVRTKRDVANWLSLPLNQEKYARAWFDGYEIEKEPLYWVRNKKGKSLLYKSYDGSKIGMGSGFGVDFQKDNIKKYTFTEQEIKDYDERYWAFAVPVEEE